MDIFKKKREEKITVEVSSEKLIDVFELAISDVRHNSSNIIKIIEKDKTKKEEYKGYARILLTQIQNIFDLVKQIDPNDECASYKLSYTEENLKKTFFE